MAAKRKTNLSNVVTAFAGPGGQAMIPLQNADFELGSAQLEMPLLKYSEDGAES